MSINAFVSDSKFIFINTQTDYILCHKAIMSGGIHGFSIGSDTAREIRPGFFADAAAEISGGVSIEPPVFISRGCKVQTGAKLGPNAFIGEYCIIGTNAEISNSVIGRNCIIGEYSTMDGAVLCSDINLGASVRVYPNTIIGNAWSHRQRRGHCTRCEDMAQQAHRGKNTYFIEPAPRKPCDRKPSSKRQDLTAR